jgi:hypothetical protein
LAPSPDPALGRRAPDAVVSADIIYQAWCDDCEVSLDSRDTAEIEAFHDEHAGCVWGDDE